MRRLPYQTLPPPPAVIYSKSESYTSFIPVPPKPIEVGDYLYKDGTTGKEASENVVGICVVPNSHTEDGMGRFMCLHEIEEDGSVPSFGYGPNIQWGVSGKTFLTGKYTNIPIVESGNVCEVKTIPITNSKQIEHFTIPSDKVPSFAIPYIPENTPKECLPPIGLSWYIPDYENDLVAPTDPIDPFFPSPYTNNREKNPMFTNYGDTSVITNDMLGWENMKYFDVKNEDTPYKAGRACYLYGKKYYDTTMFETYLPSIGELIYLVCFQKLFLTQLIEIKKYIPNTIANLGEVDGYHSSTDLNEHFNFSVSPDYSQIIGSPKWFDTSIVRPFIRLKD